MEDFEKRIKIQIEYYFSDENLETDIFFNELFSKSIEGYIDISYLLCHCYCWRVRIDHEANNIREVLKQRITQGQLIDLLQ